MSRTTTGGELTTLGLTTRKVTHRIKVQNGSGTMIDLSSWLETGKISRDVDQPVDGCTLNFTRALGATQSLSPLRTDSTLNVNDVPVYSPLLDLNRTVTVEIATTVVGTAPVSGDYKLLFKGTIDVVAFEQSPVTVVCRDLGAPLVDRWIEVEASFGTGIAGSGVGGRSIQLVMQDIIDSVFGGGIYTLYTPVSPGADLNTYKQQRMSVMDALQDLAQQIGWDVRYRWDDGTSAFRLTLSNPPRSKTTPDYTFGPSAYHDITELSLDITDVRNAITGSFRNANSQYNRNTVTRTDATSITKYGRRFMLIQEADVSPIDSISEMTTMLDSALADLKEPKANQSVNMPLHWPADLWDLYRYSPNSVHYNSDQDIAVVELTHEFSSNYHRTTVHVRGTPIGQYATWLGRGTTIGGGGAGNQAIPPSPGIEPLNTEASDVVWDLRFDARYGSGGGGTNLTYTIKSKKTFGAVTTLASGNASAFPKDLGVTRDPKYDAVISFAVTDAATGLTETATWVVPAFTNSISATGTVIGSLIDASSITTTQIIANSLVDVCALYGLGDGTHTLVSGTPTVFDWGAEDVDSAGMHSGGALSRIVLQHTGGLVFASVSAIWDGNATGYRTLRILKNGADFDFITQPAAALLLGHQFFSTIDYSPTSTDYYQVETNQNSGTDRLVSYYRFKVGHLKI